MDRIIQDKREIQYQIKSNLADYKEIDESARTIKAVANTYNYFDYDGDVLVPGAAKKSISERGSRSNANDKILHALFHDLTRLPGKSVMEAETVVNGKNVLYVESKLSETIDGEETLIKYKDGIYNQHSIGFRYMQVEIIEKGANGWASLESSLINPEAAIKQGFAYVIKEINLFEWSTVAFGANKLTPYLGVKTVNKAVQLQNIYKKLDAINKKSMRLDIKNKFIFELQVKQLKQLISELIYNREPSREDIAKQQPSSVSELPKKELNLNFITQNL